MNSASDFPDLDMVLIMHDHYDHPDYKTIGEKYGPFDLALLECGQYNEG